MKKLSSAVLSLLLILSLLFSACTDITVAGTEGTSAPSSSVTSGDTTGEAASDTADTPSTDESTEAGETESDTDAPSASDTAETEETEDITNEPLDTDLPSDTTEKQEDTEPSVDTEEQTKPQTPEETEGEQQEHRGPVPNPSPVDPEDIAEYSGDIYITVNGGEPAFTAADITSEAYEFYSELDSLGRCGYAMACVGPETLPTKDRESISSVKPTGWHGSTIYNRSHLIAHSLTGEDANVKNLITGTTLMNQGGMTQFESMVLDYVKETGNHVIYRVTPIFVGNELVARGVQMEAYSVEDDGDSISYNVYLYNVQPGYEIDYLTGDLTNEEEDAGTDESGARDYVLNKRSKKFHYPHCSGVSTMSDKNREDRHCTRDELIEEGYDPCGTCKP